MILYWQIKEGVIYSERKKLKTGINKREKAILKFIEKQINKNGYPPSVREIGEAVDLKSTATVHGYLSRLEQRGILKKKNKKVEH